MSRRYLLEIAEYVSLVGSGAGTIAAFATNQVLYAALPLTISVGFGLDSRNRLRRLSQKQQLTGLTHLHQVIEPFEERLADLEATMQKVQQSLQTEEIQLKEAIAQVHLILNPLKLQVEQMNQRTEQLETLTQQQLRELREHQQQSKEAAFSRMDEQMTQFFARIRNHIAQLEELANQTDPQTLSQLQQIKGTMAQVQEQLIPLKAEDEKREHFIRVTELEEQILQLRESFQDQQLKFSAELEPLALQVQELQAQNLDVQDSLTHDAKLQDLQAVFAQLRSSETTNGNGDTGVPVRRSQPVPNSATVNNGNGNGHNGQNGDGHLWYCANTLHSHVGGVNTLVIARYGQTFASGSDDQSIKLWQLATGQDVRTLGTPSTSRVSPVKAIALSPDGQMLASAGNDKVIQLWQVSRGQRIGMLQGHSGAITTLTFSPDGETLISGSADQTVRVWHLKTGQLLQTLTGHSEWFSGVKSVDVSPDGRLLASSSDDKTIKLWQLNTGQVDHTLVGHHDTVNDLQFSPDGQLLFSASNDGTIKGWNVSSGREVLTLTGHQGNVYTVTVSPNGRLLASGSWDRSIKLWDLEMGQEVETLTGHSAAVMALVFAQESQGNGSNPLTLISGSSDHTIRVWHRAASGS